MVNSDLRRRYQFFHANCGYIVGKKATCALDLARAEITANDRDWRWLWRHDPVTIDDVIDGTAICQCKEWDGGRHTCDFCHDDHTVLYCVLQDEHGQILDSLHGIIDPDMAYRRVVEAELASEALWEEAKAWGGCAHPVRVAA